MVRHQKIFIHALAITFFLGFAACSSKSSSPVGVTQATDPYSDTSDTSYYDGGNSNLFDSSANSNLFSTSTAGDTSATSTTYSTVTAQQQACLTGNPSATSTTSNSTTPPWYQTTGSASLNSSCLSQSFNGSYGQDMLFGLGVESFGAMQTCYQLVMSQGPQMCASGQNVDMIFKASGMALVRCFRNILDQQMALVQWEPRQRNDYQNSDGWMFYMLQMMSQME